MVSLKNFLLLTMASIRAASSGKTLVISNFDKTGYDNFSSKFSLFLHRNNDKVDRIKNPSNIKEISKKLDSEFYDTVAIQTHGNFKNQIPEMFIAGEESTPITDILNEINSSKKSNLNQIHLASCLIGTDINQIQDPTSFYYNELNKNLQNNQLLFLHGDKYTGDAADSLSKRLPNLILNKEYSIIEALIDSGESLNVVFKKDDQLKVFIAKTFGRNGEEWTIENYRNYLHEVSKDAEEFETENNILNIDSKRPDIEKMSDEELFEKMFNVFKRYFSKLIDANNINDLEILLNKLPDNEFFNKFYQESLVEACYKGNIDVVKVLVNNKNVDINFRDKNFKTAFDGAITSDNGEIIKILIKKGFDVNNKIKDIGLETTSLIKAIENNAANVAEVLIEEGADINAKDSNGRNALIQLSFKFDPHLYKYYGDIENTKKINENDRKDLILAADKNDLLNFKEIIARTHKGYEAIENQDLFKEMAKYLKQVNIFEKLVKKDVDLNAKDLNGGMALIYFVENFNADFIQTLIDKGANLNDKDIEGSTALIRLALKKAVTLSQKIEKNKTIEVLIKNGVDINAKNNYNQTALTLAISSGDTKTAKILMENGADFSLIKNEDFQNLFSANNLQSQEIEDLIQIALKLNKEGINVELTQSFLEKSYQNILRKSRSGINIDYDQIDCLAKNGLKIDKIKMNDLVSEINLNPQKNSHLINFLDANEVEPKLNKNKALPAVLIELVKSGKCEVAKSILKKNLPVKNLETNKKLRINNEKLDFLDYQDLEGNSLLIYAVKKEDKELFDLLLESGASISLTNIKGESAYRFAMQSDNKYFAKKIEESINNNDKTNNTSNSVGIIAAATVAATGIAIAGCVASNLIKKNTNKDKSK